MTEEGGAILGEKIVVRRLAKITGSYVDPYLHKTSKDLPAQVGVLVAVDADTPEARTAAHDVAVHAAAFSPSYLTRDEVPEDTVANERRIAEETARREQARAGYAEDYRRPDQRVLQGARAGRPAVRQGPQSLRG